MRSLHDGPQQFVAHPAEARRLFSQFEPIKMEHSSLQALSELLCRYDGVSVLKITALEDQAVVSLRITDADSIAKLEYFGRVANAQTGAYTQCVPGGRRASGAVGKWAWRLTFDLEPGVPPWQSHSIQIFAMFLVADLRRRNVLTRQDSRRLNVFWNGARAA